MKWFNCIVLLLLSSVTFAQAGAKDFLSGKLKKMQWKDLEVVYLEDNKLPVYTMVVYFADGALSEKGVKGTTEASFEYLSLGTNRFSQKDIADNLEFFGAEYSSNVTHEYSTYTVSGLVKDINPTLKKICHLFADATFPKKELKKEKRRVINALQNLPNNPGGLASRVFREISLSDTPFSYPVEGKMKDIKKWEQSLLKKQLAYFNEKVKKRVYITGPKSVLGVKSIVNNECGWKGQGKFVRSTTYKDKPKGKGPIITLVTVPKANQAQVRIGKFLNRDEIKDSELMDLAADYLGGGFTSRLMRSLRVESGLTYGVGAFAGGQKEYGRAGIMTSTNVKTISELLTKTKATLDKGASGDIKEVDLLRSQGSMAGSYPFGFESSSAYLTQLMYLDHVGKEYSELALFPERIRSFNAKQVAKKINELYSWDSLDIVIVGPKSIFKELKKLGKARMRSYSNFL
jgi:zinc protease